MPCHDPVRSAPSIRTLSEADTCILWHRRRAVKDGGAATALLTVLSIDLVGHRLPDALDPRVI